MTKSIPKYQIKQNLLHVVGKPKECAHLISTLKGSEDNSILHQTVSEIIQTIPKFEKRFWGNIFPKKIEELGGEKTFFFKPKSLKNEINWILWAIKHHHILVKKFVEYKADFEHLVLLGYYDKAFEVLEKVEKEIGISIWLIESKFLIYGIKGQQDKIISLLSHINEIKIPKDESTSENGFVTLLLYYLSNRSIKDLSAIRYDEDLFNNFKKNRTEFQKDHYNYYLFRLNYYKHYEIENPAIPLIMEATNSLIDRYVVLIQVLQSAFAQGYEVDTIFSRSQYLYNITKDKNLLPLVFAHNPQNDIKDYFNEKYLYIVDSYYRGDYSNVIKACKSYVKDDSSNFDILVLYCHSLLYAQNGYSPIFVDSLSPINQIGKKIYDSISEKENSSSLYNLYQLNKNFYGFSIANGLDYFIKEESNINKSARLKLLSVKYFDPFFSYIYEKEADALSYLENGLNRFKSSISIAQQIRRAKKELTANSEVVDYIVEKDNAKVAFINEKYDDSFNLWISILNRNRNRNPIAQIAIKYAFECLLQLEKYQEAIILFVEEYIKNPISIKKVDVLPFMKILKQRKYKNIKRTIELPIFVGLNSQRDTDKSFVLQSFCEYHDVKKPTELIAIIDYLDIKKIETFFYVIVNEDVLRHYVYINSTQEALEEKQVILDYLRNLKTENEDLYSRMLDEVFDELIVYKGTKKMDESKIFANDQAIIKYELKDIEGLYNRFVAQYELLESTPVLLIDSFSLTNRDTNNSDATLLTANVKYTDNAIHQVAYSLYDSIRDKFLFSKFGLVTYLSTRIRHGVLEGELRADFVANNLVFNKENERYINSGYWDRTYALNDKVSSDLYDILSDFSNSIDELISSFKSDILQIRTEITKKGLFDYDIDPETLSLEALRIGYLAKNSDEFCQLVIRNLWEITERNLQNIRHYVKNELSNQFYKLFDDLAQKTSSSTSGHIHYDISSAISNTRANLYQKLLKIEGWFHIQESKFDDFNLKELAIIVWESTKKFYPKRSHGCEFELQGANIIIKASYGIHFSDLLRIFLTNMFKYSSPLCDFKIGTSINNSVLTITFENDINIDEKELNDKFEKILNTQGKLQLEGGSGLVKAQKIVKYDLGDESNNMCIYAENRKCKAIVNINLQNLEA